MLSKKQFIIGKGIIDKPKGENNFDTLQKG
jgi:hypothetical protein